MHFSHRSQLRSLSRSSEVECNPKTNILFFDDLGGLFCFFCILVNVFCSVRSADDLVVFWQSSACLLTVFYWTSGSLLPVFCLSSACLLLVFCQSSACLLLVFYWSSGSLLVDHQKMNILFFDDLGGHFFCISVTVHNSDHSADHQKLNVIQKQTFYFLMT